jgi:hypothetical protein
MNIRKNTIGWLLNLANRADKISCKEQFYAIKKKLLLKHGTFIGEEIQHIRKECYSCEGTGKFKCEWKQTESCWGCGGTGVFEQYWTRLDKYKLGNYFFHNPTKKQYEYEPLFEKTALPLITGYIHHKTPKYRIGTEAMYWLLLIYDYAHFKKMFGTLGYLGNIRTPIVFLANLSFNIKLKWKFDVWTRNNGWFWQNKEPDWKVERAYDETEDLPF